MPVASHSTVSIGMPVFNGKSYVEDALRSLLAQDYPDFDVIISDNASTDGTEELCRGYAQRDPRVRYFRNAQNIGAAKNFTRVFERSSAKYFMWAAHDDLWAPTYVSKCVAALEENPGCALCGTGIQFIDEAGRAARYSRDFNRVDTRSLP